MDEQFEVFGLLGKLPLELVWRKFQFNHFSENEEYLSSEFSFGTFISYPLICTFSVICIYHSNLIQSYLNS